MNTMIIRAVPVSHTTDGQDGTGKFKLVDGDGVLDRFWPDIVKDPVMYASVDAALDAAETMFAVGQNHMGQTVKSLTRVGDERIELTLSE